MKIKLLSFCLLSSFMGSINAADSVQPAIPAGKQASHGLAQRIEPLEDLKPMLMEIIESLLLENAELKQQLGQTAVPFLVTPYCVPPSINQNDSLTGVEFVQALFANLREWLLGTISELEQENTELGKQLAIIKRQEEIQDNLSRLINRQARQDDLLTEAEAKAKINVLSQNALVSGCSFVSGKYRIGGSFEESDSSGTVNLKFGGSDVQISDFKLIEGSYYHKVVIEKSNSNPNIQPYYPLFAFKEREVAKFILEEMPKRKFVLNYKEKSLNMCKNTSQYGQSLKFNDTDLYIKFIVEQAGRYLALWVDCDNGLVPPADLFTIENPMSRIGSAKPNQEFLLYKISDKAFQAPH